jgi:hypothetical protein
MSYRLVLEGGNLQAIEKSDFLKKSPPLKWSGNFRHPVLGILKLIA